MFEWMNFREAECSRAEALDPPRERTGDEGKAADDGEAGATVGDAVSSMMCFLMYDDCSARREVFFETNALEMRE